MYVHPVRAHTHARSRALGVSNDGDVHLASIEMYTFMYKNFGGVRDRGWVHEYSIRLLTYRMI
jgi:hypothetical protein